MTRSPPSSSAFGSGPSAGSSSSASPRRLRSASSPSSSSSSSAPPRSSSGSSSASSSSASSSEALLLASSSSSEAPPARSSSSASSSDELVLRVALGLELGDDLADGERLPLVGDDLQYAGRIGLVGHRGLVGLDLCELVALGDLVPVGLQPLQDRALLHGVGQARHRDLGHRCRTLFPRARRVHARRAEGSDPIDQRRPSAAAARSSSASPWNTSPATQTAGTDRTPRSRASAVARASRRDRPACRGARQQRARMDLAARPPTIARCPPPTGRARRRRPGGTPRARTRRSSRAPFA